MIKIFLGGAVGTAVMTFMMYFIRPMIVGEPMDIAAKIGATMGNNWALGMTVHVLIGVVIIPLIYAFVLYKILPGLPVIKGALMGIAFWLLNMTVAMPSLGEGMFLSNSAGGPKALVAAFMVHVIYGALLGLISGKIDKNS